MMASTGIAVHEQVRQPWERIWPNVTGANVSALRRTIDLVVVVFTQRHTTLFDQRLELGSHFFAGSCLSFKVLL